MRIFLILLLILTPFTIAVDEEEEQGDFLDLELLSKGEELFQTAPDADGKAFFLLRQAFPSATTTVTNAQANEQSPSVNSTNDAGDVDNRYALFGTVGQVVAGSSEDAPHFSVKSGFFAATRRSVYRRRGVSRRRAPINIQRRTQ